MHVGHNVLADGNVSADGLGSPVVVSVDGASVDGDFVVEDLADVMVVTFGLDGGVERRGSNVVFVAHRLSFFDDVRANKVIQGSLSRRCFFALCSSKLGTVLLHFRNDALCYCDSLLLPDQSAFAFLVPMYGYKVVPVH